MGFTQAIGPRGQRGGDCGAERYRSGTAETREYSEESREGRQEGTQMSLIEFGEPVRSRQLRDRTRTGADVSKTVGCRHEPHVQSNSARNTGPAAAMTWIRKVSDRVATVQANPSTAPSRSTNWFDGWASDCKPTRRSSVANRRFRSATNSANLPSARLASESLSEAAREFICSTLCRGAQLRNRFGEGHVGSKLMSTSCYIKCGYRVMNESLCQHPTTRPQQRAERYGISEQTSAKLVSGGTYP